MINFLLFTARKHGLTASRAKMRFTLAERIGQGAFGEVFRACDPHNGAIVALKKIRLRRIEDGLPINAFRELRALQELCHPHVVQLIEVVADGAHVVLVMEYMASDLAHIIAAARGSLPAAAIKAFAQMMFRGLEHIHSHRMVHRDIKPSNLLDLKLEALSIHKLFC